jgi:NAD(P)-dependent dehydrogenase (short-subunit alcohol dehydrogenase family)
MKKKKNLNIIMSGANEGIGYYMLQGFLKQGHKVCVLDIKVNQLEQLAAQYPKENFSYFQCDIRNEDEVKSFIALAIRKYQKIDYLIHNACLCVFESFMETEVKIFHEVYEVNLFGAINMIKHVLPHLEENQGGSVFITSSGVGVMGFSNISAYASSKGALESLVKCLSLEYQEKKISFYLIHPPLTKTKSSEGLAIPKEFMASPKNVGEGLAKRIHHKKRITTYRAKNRFTVGMMYFMPVAMGKLLNKMTKNYSPNHKI